MCSLGDPVIFTLVPHPTTPSATSTSTLSHYILSHYPIPITPPPPPPPQAHLRTTPNYLTVVSITLTTPNYK